MSDIQSLSDEERTQNEHGSGESHLHVRWGELPRAALENRAGQTDIDCVVPYSLHFDFLPDKRIIKQTRKPSPSLLFRRRRRSRKDCKFCSRWLFHEQRGCRRGRDDSFFGREPNFARVLSPFDASQILTVSSRSRLKKRKDNTYVQFKCFADGETASRARIAWQRATPNNTFNLEETQDTKTYYIFDTLSTKTTPRRLQNSLLSREKSLLT